MSVPLYNLTDTWNDSGTVFTGIKLNVTDTSSSASSLLMDLQVNGVSKFKVDKTGRVIRYEDRIKLFPMSNEPPAANYATLDTRNGHPVLDFDDTTAEYAVFTDLMLRQYGGAGLTIEIGYSMTSAVTGTCGWTVCFERLGDQQWDSDYDGFASEQTVTAVTVPSDAGLVDVVSVNVSNGANMDSIAAGELFRIKVKRDVANDTATGDAELHWLAIREQ